MIQSYFDQGNLAMVDLKTADSDGDLAVELFTSQLTDGRTGLMRRWDWSNGKLGVEYEMDDVAPHVFRVAASRALLTHCLYSTHSIESARSRLETVLSPFNSLPFAVRCALTASGIFVPPVVERDHYPSQILPCFN